jgi:hypothetical protein
MNRLVHFLIVIVTVLAFLSPTLSAQPLWMQPRQDNLISLEWYKLEPFEKNDLDFISGTFFLGLKFPLSPDLKLVGEIPFSYVSGTFSQYIPFGDGPNQIGFTEDFSKFLLGNIYVGLELGSRERAVFYEVGMRLPTLEDFPELDITSPSFEDDYGDFIYHFFAMQQGMLSDIERYGAFMPFGTGDESQYLCTQGMINYQPELAPSGLGFHLRGGPVLFIPTDKGNLEAGLLYTAQGILKSGSMHMLAGLSGLAPVTAEDFKLAEDMIHHLTIAVNFDLNGFTPGLQFRLPLDKDSKEIFNNSIAIQLGYTMN